MDINNFVDVDNREPSQYCEKSFENRWKIVY